MERVTVLLSSYNGEKYLREQLDSVLKQKEIRVSILARDDGSTDGTVDILEEYRRNGQAEYFTGSHMGAARSFLDLLNRAPQSPYYALCDQDDIWLPGKLKAAVAQLKKAQGPALFYHGVQLIDPQGIKTGYYIRKQEQAQSLPCSVLFGDEIPGCTMVFNHALAEAVKEYRPEYLTMHDGWIHRVCLCVGGRVTGDETVWIYYRQHEKNTVGMKKKSLCSQLAQLMRREQKFSRLAKEMLKGYERYLSEEDRQLLEQLSGCHTGWDNKRRVLYKGFCSRASVKEKVKLMIKAVYGTL